MTKKECVQQHPELPDGEAMALMALMEPCRGWIRRWADEGLAAVDGNRIGDIES